MGKKLRRKMDLFFIMFVMLTALGGCSTDKTLPEIKREEGTALREEAAILKQEGTAPRANAAAPASSIIRLSAPAETSESPYPAGKTVRVGYYYTEDSAFQDGFEDSARKSGYAYEYYQAIAGIAGWNYEYVYGSRSELLDELLEGKVDIMAGVIPGRQLQKKVLFPDYDMGLGGVPQYFAVSSLREDLLQDLNDALWRMEHYMPDYAIELFQKYYNRGAEQVLTDAQMRWIADKGAVRIGYVRYALPLSDQNADGNPDGMIVELMDAVNRYSGLDMEPVCFDNIHEMEAGLQSGAIDMAFPVYSDLWLNETKGIRQTDSFVSDHVMMLYRGVYSDDMMERIALSETDLGIEYHLENTYPDSQIVFYPSREETLAAVRRGEIRCAVGCASIIQRLLQEYPEYQELNIAYLDYTGEFGMAVHRDNKELLDILNMTIRQMDRAAITGAMVKYSNVEPTYDFREFVRKYSEYVFLALLGFIIFLLVIFTIHQGRNRAFNAERAKAHAELEKALEAANAANRAKTVFLSSMSHDIRTPMNAIMGMSTVARMHLDDRERVEDCLGKIEVSSNHLLTLINNVLDISKIESGQMQLNPTTFSLQDKVEDLLHIVEPQAQAKHLALEAQIPPYRKEWVYADEVRINQIFINLLTNAIKYTPDGGKIAVVLTEEIVQDGEMMHITYSVEDNGIGMSEEFMQSMYDTFSRAKDSRINKIQGTGLGLAIVKQMVEMMDGTIECVSEENKGTRFVVKLALPVQYVEEESGAQRSEKNVAERLENDFMAGRHLLVTEDNELNWEVISSILEMLQVRADWAQNGQICLEMLEDAPDGQYDMVLMDVQMPVMNGRETAMAIRKSERESIRNIPIIAMTADAFAEDVEASMAAGMNGHVSKPIDIDKMLKEMRRVLESAEKVS